MTSGSTKLKLEAILLVDLIVVSLGVVGYFYVGALPKPPIGSDYLQFSDFSYNVTRPYTGQPVGVSINVTNVGRDEGGYNAVLELDGRTMGSHYLLLKGGATSTLSFSLPGLTEGSHKLVMGTAEGLIKVIPPFIFSNLAVNRTLAGIGEPVGVTLTVRSQVSDALSCPLSLMINGSVVGNRSIEVSGGSSQNVEFGVVEDRAGTYSIEVAGLTGTFSVAEAVPPPRPASFTLSSLSVAPVIAFLGSAVNVSIYVANSGELTGNCSVTLFVSGVPVDSKNLTLSGGASTTVLFSVMEGQIGSFDVKVGNLTGSFLVRQPTTIALYFITTNPFEVHPGETVNVSIMAQNRGASPDSIPVQLLVDDAPIATKTIRLDPGQEQQVTFLFPAGELTGAANMQKCAVYVEGHVDSFLLVRTGYHTLSVGTMSNHAFEITVNNKTYVTPEYYDALPEGTYVISVPATDPTGKYTFVSWQDNNPDRTRTIFLSNRTRLLALYAGGTDSSCPSLFLWNGTDYAYVSDVSNHGWLGYINYINSDGTVVFYRNNPWDYVPLGASQMASVNGIFNLRLVQRWDEIFYLDQAYLVVVDHPYDVSVYSTMVEQYLDQAYMGNIYTVGPDVRPPVSAVNQDGTDVLAQISKVDGVFTSGTNGIQSPSWDNITWNRITMNLGDLSNASQIKLVVNAVVDWGSSIDYGNWLNQFFGGVPNGTQVTPPPYMEVKDAGGNWVRVPDSREVPLPPDGVARTFVVDLTGLFPTNDYSLRISNFWNVTFDYIGVDTSPQRNISVTRIDPQATLFQDFVPTATSSGNFTRYGDVTPLVASADDMFVVGRQGDAVQLMFDASSLAKPAQGMVRDYFFFVSCWFKDSNGNWGFGFGFTVDPLPFHDMSGFPYPQSESYPYDAAHLAYLAEYETRVVAPP